METEALRQSIFQTAISAHRRGYTVLPFNADKMPRVAWGAFRETKPTEEDINNWHSMGLLDAGFGYLTGNSSNRLLVIDFDDLGKAFDFEEKFPELSKTYKVATKRGLHYYYLAAKGFDPVKRQLGGVDILWDCPVIAPPTPNYSATNPKATPQQITQAEVNAVIRHFAPRDETSAAAAIGAPLMSIDDLLAALRRAMDKESRNQALFSILCLARDNGFSKYSCITSGLMDIFVFAPAPLGHKQESQRAREKEFHRTLESAYKRAPRSLQETEARFLSDDARQRLLNADLAGAARLLDALAHNFKAGAILSRQQIIEACPGIAHKIIDSALNAVFEGKMLFTRSNPSPAPLPDIALEKSLNKDALYGWKKRGKSLGRPKIAFHIPSAEAIQRFTGAIYRASTSIKFEQIDSIRDYRAALLKGKLDRERVGHYQGFLSRIVGVCTRTIRNYIKLIDYEGIEQTQLIGMVNWDNVNAYFEANDWGRSYFLIDHTGKKAPANLGAVLWMLKAKKAVRIVKQIGSIYLPKKAKELYQSAGFRNDLEALIQAFEAGKSMNVTTVEKPLKWSENQELARELAIQEYWASIKQATQEATPEELSDRDEKIKLTRAALRSVREDAAALCLLMPTKMLTYENAAKLLLQYGTEKVMQCATKAVMDYFFSKRSERPIKNVVAVIVSRLRKGK